MASNQTLSTKLKIKHFIKIGFIAGLLHTDSAHVYLKLPHTDSSLDTASLVASKLILHAKYVLFPPPPQKKAALAPQQASKTRIALCDDTYVLPP